jgi:hypothetical protein
MVIANLLGIMRFHVVTSVTMKGVCCLLGSDAVQSGRNSPKSKNRSSRQEACDFDLCFLGLLFDPEDGGSTFLRNVGRAPDYRTKLPRRQYSSKGTRHRR